MDTIITFATAISPVAACISAIAAGFAAFFSMWGATTQERHLCKIKRAKHDIYLKLQPDKEKINRQILLEDIEKNRPKNDFFGIWKNTICYELIDGESTIFADIPTDDLEYALKTLAPSEWFSGSILTYQGKMKVFQIKTKHAIFKLWKPFRTRIWSRLTHIQCPKSAGENKK